MKANEFLRSARSRLGRVIHARRSRFVKWQSGVDGAVVRIECFDNRGVLIPIVPDVASDFIAEAIRSGSYESHEVALLDGLIEPGEVILEIGGGCGFISAYCAKNPLTKAVHSVEANPNLIEVIKLTHRLNCVSVSVYHEILSKQDGEADFYLHKDFWASGTHKILGASPIKVRTTSFQSKLDALRPTMLIVDIEGGEQNLFENVNLSCVNKIMLELHQQTIGGAGIKKIFDLLSSQNFHYETSRSKMAVVTFSRVNR